MCGVLNEEVTQKGVRNGQKRWILEDEKVKIKK